uniref:Uncharacterized protein n=1 Tax=Tetraselmis sp. GSL018 TaxID=582737 RepID=A0A061SCV4_9CHLO
MRIGAPGLASETAVTARRTQRRLCNLLREKKPQGFKFRGKCQLVPRRLFSVANCPPLTSFRGVHLLASSNCSSRLDHHESQGQTCTPCTFQHIQFLSGDSSLLDKLSSNKLTISSHDEILMELRLDLKRLEHSPEGRAVLLARRQADAAALQEDVRLRSVRGPPSLAPCGADISLLSGSLAAPVSQWKRSRRAMACTGPPWVNDAQAGRTYAISTRLIRVAAPPQLDR